MYIGDEIAGFLADVAWTSLWVVFALHITAYLLGWATAWWRWRGRGTARD